MIHTLPKSLIDTAKKILTEAQHPMIDVDGEMRHRHNSNGVPIHHSDEGIKNFHRWFHDGQTDEHGRPQVFYHGTPSQESIKTFIPGGKDTSEKTGDAYGLATYLTTSKHEASSYSRNKGAVYPVYVRGKFLDLDAEHLGDEESHKLTKYAADQLLPSDKARFDTTRKTHLFQPHEIDSATDFFENKKKDYHQFGDGYDRNFPTVDKLGNNFLISYVDYEAPVKIKSGHDAQTLFKATGFDNIPSTGYDGIKMKMSGGKNWIVNHRPSHTIKSALGNTGEFNHHENINESSGDNVGTKLNWAIGKDIDKAQAPYRQKNNKIVWLNAEEVLPKVHPDFRVIPESGMNHIGNRMDKAKSHFASGGYMDPPDVVYNAQHPKYPVGIDNGRHRIAAALSMGEKWFPASVEPDDVPQLKKHISVMEKKPA